MLALFLSSCRGTQSYSQQDLQDAKRAWSALHPTLLAFEQAYKTGNASVMAIEFRRNENTCKIVDGIDKRDTIDPNVRLFYASITLDDVCNNIESVYALYRQTHHLAYDNSITASRPGAEFLGLDKELSKMPSQLRDPGALD